MKDFFVLFILRSLCVLKKGNALQARYGVTFVSSLSGHSWSFPFVFLTVQYHVISAIYQRDIPRVYWLPTVWLQYLQCISNGLQSCTKPLILYIYDIVFQYGEIFLHQELQWRVPNLGSLFHVLPVLICLLLKRFFPSSFLSDMIMATYHSIHIRTPVALYKRISSMCYKTDIYIYD